MFVECITCALLMRTISLQTDSTDIFCFQPSSICFSVNTITPYEPLCTSPDEFLHQSSVNCFIKCGKNRSWFDNAIFCLSISSHVSEIFAIEVQSYPKSSALLINSWISGLSLALSRACHFRQSIGQSPKLPLNDRFFDRLLVAHAQWFLIAGLMQIYDQFSLSCQSVIEKQT